MNRNYSVTKTILNVLKHSLVLDSVLLCAIIGVVFLGLIPPQILKSIIDENLVNKDLSGILNKAILYMVILIFVGIFDFIKEASLTIFGQKITKDIRYQMMKKLSFINAKYFTTYDSGAIVSRFINDVDAINSMFTSGIIGMFIDSFKILGIVISIWIFSKRLGIITLCLLPIIYFITRLFQKGVLKAQINHRKIVASVNNHILESLKNIFMIKSYSKEKYMEDKNVNHLLNNYITLEKVNFYDSIFPPLIQMLRAIIISLIIVLSAKELNFLGISLGMIAATIELISNLFTPIENLGMEFQNIQQAISGITRVNEFYQSDEDNSKNYQINIDELIRHKDKININFNHIDFAYDENNEILNDINISINPLSKVAFVGRTGVGKSTLFKLIMGLLKPSSGNITINGIDVYQIPNSQKRKIFGYVDQNFYIVEGSVGDQISLYDPNITNEQINDVLEFVGLKDYVLGLDKGLDTKVTNNMFSQGQKQLMSIARAIVSNPPILLLDEITANLDAMTEEKIVSILQRTSEEHTILSISHRLSSMISSDMIVILENGKVKNYGSPTLLLENDEWYRSHIALEKLTWDK